MSTITTIVSFDKLYILFPAYCSGLFLELKNRSGPAESRFLVLKRQQSGSQFSRPCGPCTASPARRSGYRAPEPGRVPKLWGGSGPQTDCGHICPCSCITAGEREKMRLEEDTGKRSEHLHRMGLSVTEHPPAVQNQPKGDSPVPSRASAAVSPSDIFRNRTLLLFFFTLISKSPGGVIDTTDSLQIHTGSQEGCVHPRAQTKAMRSALPSSRSEGHF